MTVVKLADVGRMERSGDGLEPSPVFEIELASGDKIDGVLQESDLQVQAGNHVLRVPVQHFIAARSSGAPERVDAGGSDELIAPPKPGQSRVSGRRAVVPQSVPEP